MRSSSARSVPGRVAAPMRASSSTRSGRVQVGNATSSSAPSRKTGSSRPSASSESTVRANGSSDTSASAIAAKASSARRSLISGRRVDLLVARVGDDADQQPVEPEVVDRLAGERDVPDVRRIEGATEDPDAIAHCQIMTSSPISTSEPGLTPASRRASSSSSPSGAVPTTRNPWPVRKHLEPAALGRARAVLEEVRQLLRDGRGLLDLLRAEREEQRLELVDAGSRRARDAVHGDDALVLHRERRRLGIEVGLVQHDELRPLAETGPVGGELAVDHAVALVGVALGRVDHVQQQAGALEMGEELVPEPDALARALDQARHVRNRELPAVGPVDRAEHRRQRRERVVGHLRLRIRDPPQERRLAGVRQPGAGGVGHQLEVELELVALARHPRLGDSAASAGSASRSWSSRARRRHRARRRSASRPDARSATRVLVVGVRHLRPHGDGEDDVVAVGAVLARAAAVAAAPGIEDRLRAERREVAQVGIRDENDVAAAAAVAAVRARPSARTSRGGS